MRVLVIAAGLLATIAPASAQNAGPLLVQQAEPLADNVAVLPANTEVYLRLNDELTTKGKTMDVGHSFALSVTTDVMLGQYVVIPRGSRATGKVVWMTDKGMFGKSGKFEIEITHVDVGARRIPLEGKFRQEGEGNTVATIGAVVVLPVAGFFLTGKSGRMAAGTELTVFTAEDLKVQFDGPAPVQNAPMVVSKTNEPEGSGSSDNAAPDDPRETSEPAQNPDEGGR